ncbi:MAG: pseudouridine synthase [Chloroflexota bacterium]|nr:pseudouridine synthase [Chloroflexota bacterium]
MRAASAHAVVEEGPIEPLERLQRVLAARGIASRRRAEELIRAGRVVVDGRVVTELGTKVDPRAAAINVDGKPLRAQRLRYVLLNKPSGYITTTDDERGRRTVMDLVPSKERIYPVGRLDRDTEGLLLLTNDGEMAHRVMHPRHELAKEYHVVTLTRPSEATARSLRAGVTIEGRLVVPDEFRILRESREGIVLKLVIHEGMYHAVRRMMDAVGIPVQALRRVRLGPLTVAGIPLGGWRELSEGERGSLFESLRLARAESAEDLGGPVRRPLPRGGGPASRTVPSPLKPAARTAEPAEGVASPSPRRVASPAGRPRPAPGPKRAARPSDGKASTPGPATNRPRRVDGTAAEDRQGSGPPRHGSTKTPRGRRSGPGSSAEGGGTGRAFRKNRGSTEGKPRDEDKGRRSRPNDGGDRRRRSDDDSKEKTGGRGQQATPRRSGIGGKPRRPAKGADPRRKVPNRKRNDDGRGPASGADER